MKLLKIMGFIAVFVLPALVLWKGLLYTDNPAIEELSSPKQSGVCAYRDCQRTAEAAYPAKVVEKTESQINRTVIYTGTRAFPLCSKHARYALGGRWPQQGIKWFLGLGLWLFLSGFISLGVTGLGFYVIMSRKKKAPLSNVRPRPAPKPAGPSFRPKQKSQGSVTILKE